MVRPSASLAIVRLPTSEAARTLRPLFEAMYRHFENVTGRPMLRDNGFEAWLGMYDKVVDRNRLVVAAVIDDKPVGFIEGLTRTPASYAPPGLHGFVAHTFVVPSARGARVAQTLFEDLVRWFDTKGVSSIELQVLHANDTALPFWQAQGFVSDLYQMRLSR